MTVVDTNVIAYLFLQGHSTAQAEKLLEVESEWTVPFLWRSEFPSVLAFYVRQKIITLDLGLRIAREAELWMQDREYEVNSTPVSSQFHFWLQLRRAVPLRLRARQTM